MATKDIKNKSADIVNWLDDTIGRAQIVQYYQRLIEHDKTHKPKYIKKYIPNIKDKEEESFSLPEVAKKLNLKYDYLKTISGRPEFSRLISFNNRVLAENFPLFEIYVNRYNKMCENRKHSLYNNRA